MRFCPFCAQETSDDAGRCVHCGRRLGARTAQNTLVPTGGQGPAAPARPAAPIKPTMLGIGPATAPGDEADEGGGGPTTIGGPAGILGDAEPSAPHRGATRAAASGRRGADAALDEETQLPPPAPGLEAPTTSFDPPTSPGIRTGARRGGSGPNAGARPQPQGQAPVRRLPEDSAAAPGGPRRPASGPRGEAPAVPEPSEGADLTSPMSRIEAESLLFDGPGALFGGEGDRPKSSQSAIPALPPPPTPQAAPQATPSSLRSSPLEATPLQPARPVTASLPVRLPPSATAEMPVIPAAPPSPSILGAVRYLWPVARGLLARRKEGARIRKSLVVVQQSLDGILLRLGRVAFEEKLRAPHLSEEMALLRQADERRAYALSQTTQLVTVRRTEEQRRGTQEGDLQQAIDTLSREAEKLDGELRQRAAERRRAQAELSRIDDDLRRLARTAEEADARAQQAQGPAASQARAQADSARGQAEALRPQREARQRDAEALEEPIDQLTQALALTRSELGLRRQELTRQRAEKEKLLAELDADMGRSQAEQEAAEREMQQRMMTVGTLINLHREAGPRYEPLYQQIDEIKAQLTAYEATLARLDTESISYDQEAVQKALLLLGGAGLLLGLLIAAVYLIWAFRTSAAPGA